MGPDASLPATPSSLGGLSPSGNRFQEQRSLLILCEVAGAQPAPPAYVLHPVYLSPGFIPTAEGSVGQQVQKGGWGHGWTVSGGGGWSPGGGDPTHSTQFPDFSFSPKSVLYC